MAGIREEEDVGKLLLDGSDAAGILTFDYIYNFLGKSKGFFLYNLAALDYVNGYVVVDESKNVKV